MYDDTREAEGRSPACRAASLDKGRLDLEQRLGGSRRSAPGICRQKCAHRDADYMIDALLSGRRSKVEEQWLEQRGLAGIKELRGCYFDVRDRQIAGSHLVLKIAAEPGDPGRRTGLVKLLADGRHALRDADHGA